MKTTVAVLVAALLAGLTGCGAGPAHVSARFTDSVGLYVGNDVDVLGIKVGSVTAIHPEGTHVVVDMDLDPDVKVPADVQAATVSPSVVTDRRVELTPVYRGGPTLRDGDIIPADRTHTPVEIDRVFSAADRLARALNAANTANPGGPPVLTDALTVAAQDFKGNGDKVRQGLHGLATAVGIGADHTDQLVELIKDVDRLTGQAADNDALIRRFTGNLADATTLADQQGPPLRKALDNVDDLLDQTRRLITEHRDTAEDVLRNARVTAHTVAGRPRELAETLDELPTLFQNLYNVADPVRKAARAHVGLDQVLLDNQLLQVVCSRLNLPVLCTLTPNGQMPDTNLALLLLGGAATR